MAGKNKNKSTKVEGQRSIPTKVEVVTYRLKLPSIRARNELLSRSYFHSGRAYRLVVVLAKDQPPPEDWIVDSKPGNHGVELMKWSLVNRLDELQEQYLATGARVPASRAKRVRSQWHAARANVEKLERQFVRARQRYFQSCERMVLAFGKATIVVGDASFDPTTSRENVFYLERKGQPTSSGDSG